MSAPRESVAVTLLIAVAVALFCSAMVSGAVYVLRPIQSAYGLIERNRAIVELTTDLDARQLDLSDAAVVQAFLDLDARVLDLGSGEFVDALDGRSFDHWARSSDESAQDPTEASKSRLVPVYFVDSRSATAARLVLPVDGRGMWSTIHGYVALDADLSTIAGVNFYQHGETPGIGDRIEDAAWRATWVGKKIFDESGAARIRVARDGEGPDEHRVDLISGASVTSGSVGRLVNEWFGADGYGPWLARLREETGGQAGGEDI